MSARANNANPAKGVKQAHDVKRARGAGKNRDANAPSVLRRARGWVAGGVIGALVLTIAIVSSGFDAQEVLREEPNVWVAREAGQYARVNTETGEIDTVRKVAEPSGVLQIGAESVVLANSNGKAWPVDAALPGDFVEASQRSGATDTDDPEAGDGDAADNSAADDSADSLPNGTETDPTADEPSDAAAEGVEAVRMPDGTRDILVEGNYMLLRTETGAAYIGSIDRTLGEQLARQLQSLQQIDPLAEEAAEEAEAAAAAAEAAGDDEEEAATAPDAMPADVLGLRTDAIALDANGTAVLYSASDGVIWRFDAVRDEFVGSETKLPTAAHGLEQAQLAIVHGDWVLLDPETGTLWRQGNQVTQLELNGAPRLQASGDGVGANDDVLVADVSGLWRVSSQGTAERIADGEGTPAQPNSLDGVQFAAWIGQNSGTLWSAESGDPGDTTTLTFDDSARDLGEVSPVFYTNGDRAVLGEARTGMLWTLPDGKLIPLSQWTISDPPKEDQGTVIVDEVTEQVPPTAVDDRFGVRQGEPAPLPVLLNDFDPNKRDVLTIVPESLSESPLDEAFGTLELMPDGQSLMVRPQPDASGSATFTYRVSDGALSSDPAQVTVSVVEDGTNTPPAWCPVEGCQRDWEVPAIAPGGTLVYPILDGWVDPEGDPMMLAGVELLRLEDPAHAIVTANGDLAVRHTDANAGASEIMLRVQVRDAHGEEQQRDLQVSVQPGATARFAPMAATVQVDNETVLEPLERVAGGSGAFQLTGVSVQSGSERVRATARVSDGSIDVVAVQPGGAILSVGVRDLVTGSEFTGQIRVTATSGAAPLALPPLRAFVRPFTDSTVEILSAIPGASARAVSVQSANVVDGALRADVIAHARVRVAGSTPDGGPGRVGSVDVTVAEGATGVQGRLTVFQVPESGGLGAVAVPDSATVRAGSVVDIRVLDNDVASPGERLILHPEVTGSGAEGELAFASGSTLRYLAPTKPGTYRLSYTTYGASTPEAGDVGTVTVNVLPRGANQDPVPATVTVRLAPGEQAETRVPLSGVDPDGDRVRLTGVTQVEDAQLTASISSAGTALQVAASAQAKPGLRTVEYSVRDGEGGRGVGTLRIIVTSSNGDAGAPIVSSDYIRLVRGAADPVSVRPLDNDIDPARGSLTITEVVPNVPGGEENSGYSKLRDRLDLSRMKQGIVSVAPGDELGTVSYRYTVKSSESQSTSDGLLLVQTSERVGSQAPTITDTVLNVRERAELSSNGVDVISDKVRWASGDPDSLELSLWAGNKSGYRVSGRSITGDYNPDGDLVAFQLSGVDASGEQVTSYGFLIIPPLDELRITLKAGLAPLSVDENKTVTAGFRSFLDVAASDRVELDTQSFPVGRAQASCQAVSETEITYSAGAEAPWEDTCLVSARLVGQTNWTQLPVPVLIVPRAPSVQLTALTRTVAPGASETINFADMVEWQGGRAGDLAKLNFSVSGGGSVFDIVQEGASVTVAARADVTPGSQEGLTVQVAGQGASQAPLTLRIGEAPKDQPRGGTVNLTCTVGSNCGTDVIGVGGEYDPFAGKRGGGLILETVSGSSCTFGKVSKASDRGVTVSWPDSRGPGGTCTVGYTVRDAQGRIGEGSIELNAQGVPRAPASVEWTDFTRSSATFTVHLGAAQTAHPALTGVELQGPGNSLCAPSGPSSYQCEVTGLQNGSPGSYSARAVNAVGASDSSGPVRAWAYAAPEAQKVTVTQLETPDNTDPNSGTVRISVSGSRDVQSYEVTAPGMPTQKIEGSTGTTKAIAVSTGRLVVTAVPLTAHEVPTIRSASANGEPGIGEANVVGAPTIGNVTFTKHSRESGIVTASGIVAKGPNGNIEPTMTYGAARSQFIGGGASCTQSDPIFAVKSAFTRYQPIACAQTPYGKASLAGAKASIGGNMPAPTGNSYTVATTPTAPDANGTIAYVLQTPDPVVPSVPDAFVEYTTGDTVVLDPENIVQIQARQCLSDEPDNCSGWMTLKPETAPTTVRVTPTGECIKPGDQQTMRNAVQVSGAANWTGFSVAYDAATSVLKLTWSSSFQPLDPATLSIAACPDPDPPADSDSETP